MTDRERILDKYPTAYCAINPHEDSRELGLIFSIKHKSWMTLSAWKPTEEEAWADAVSRMTGENVSHRAVPRFRERVVRM